MAAGDVTALKKPSTPEQPPARNVYEAIAAVMADLSHDGVSKDRKNQAQGYNFRGVDDIYNALAPILSKHRLCIIPKVLARTCEERQTAKGGIMYSVTCHVEFTLACAADGSTITATTFGEAMDSGDKATNKAMSAAYKYMAFQTFCIPTEGDNDADAATPPPVERRAPASKPGPKPLAFDVDRMERTLTAVSSVEELAAWKEANRQFWPQLTAGQRAIFKAGVEALELQFDGVPV